MQRRHLPPLNALRTFEAAARHLHMGKAADELGVTHGAVSKQIVNLEDQLGFPLFHRLGNRLELTDQGQKLLKAATTAFDQLGYAIARLEGETIAGELRVSVPSAFAEKWLVPRLAKFVDAAPALKLSLLSANASYDSAGGDVLGDGLDLAVRFGEPVWKDGTARLLSHVGSFPVCSPLLLSEGSGLATPNDLLQHTLLLDDPQGANWLRWLKRAGVSLPQLPRALYFQDFNLLLAAAKQGLGLCLADRITAGEDLARGHLLRPFRQSIEHLGAYFIVLPPLVLPAARAFADWLEAEMALAGAPDEFTVS
ncbi:LysR substrate-binding domain-containing protein [Dongia sp.]|uniref:LysR substrate-binding domain-containing protein n=1 Tax=Dongia sp. TaxID=1977262 RepID=UPI0035ADDF58